MDTWEAIFYQEGLVAEINKSLTIKLANIEATGELFKGYRDKDADDKAIIEFFPNYKELEWDKITKPVLLSTNEYLAKNGKYQITLIVNKDVDLESAKKLLFDFISQA